MSDMGDMFREMREEKQARRRANLDKAEVEITADRGMNWTKHNEHHYSLMLQDKKLQYWPSANRWNWNGKSFAGTYPNLKAFIRNRQ